MKSTTVQTKQKIANSVSNRTKRKVATLKNTGRVSTEVGRKFEALVHKLNEKQSEEVRGNTEGRKQRDGAAESACTN